MSDFSVPTVRIGKVGKHPNADTLSITQVEGCPVIFRTGDFNPGDLAVYVPVDSVVTKDVSCAALQFLKFNGQGKHRVRAVRLRGIFSMGILIPNQKLDAQPGDQMAATLGIEKYEEPADLLLSTESIKDPGLGPAYGVEHYRKYKDVLIPEEIVVVTEKIHGCNARFCYSNGQMYAGSHNCWKKFNEESIWWRAVKQHDLEAKLKDIPDFVLYGEVYGWVQDLRYGMKQGEFKFAAFDLLKSSNRSYSDYMDFTFLTDQLEIPTVPELYLGPYQDEDQIMALTKGASTLANNIREGVVIKPLEERYSEVIGSRVVLKLHSEDYLLRRGGTEAH